MLQRLCQREQCKLAYKLPSAANLLQRYAFLLKDARNYWKIFKAEEDKKKKGYPRLPDVWGKKDTPYYILFQTKHDRNLYGARNNLAFPIRNKARHQLNYSQSLFVEQRVVACLHLIIREIALGVYLS